jgi:hypothetical protein
MYDTVVWGVEQYQLMHGSYKVLENLTNLLCLIVNLLSSVAGI